MKNKCKKINIPTVDNEDIECNKYINSKCVRVTELENEVKVFFGLDDNPSLNTVLTKIMNSLIELRNSL